MVSAGGGWVGIVIFDTKPKFAHFGGDEKMAWWWGGKGISERCNNQQTMLRAWRVEGIHMKAWVCLLWVSKLHKLQNQPLMWKKMGYGKAGDGTWCVAKSRHKWAPQPNQRYTTINQHTTTYSSVFFGGRVIIFMMGLSEWCREGRKLEVKIWWVGVENVGLQQDTTIHSKKSTCIS